MKVKSFLLLMGVSVVGFFVSVLLHNFFYALAVVTEHLTALHYLSEFLHAVFFLVAVFVCPLAFVVGVTGGIVTHFRKKIPKKEIKIALNRLKDYKNRT